MRRALPHLVAAAALLVGLGSCSSQDGRALPPPDPDQTTTTAPTIGTPAPGDQGVREVFTLFSPDFGEGDALPDRYTCAGEGTSPPLDWVSPPPAAELALVVRDRDAGGFVHWVLTRMDPAVLGFGPGGVPEGSVQASNSAGTIGWTPACPPAGSGSHTYDFTLHALPEPIALEPGAPAEDAARLVESASSASATLTATATG